MNIGAVIAEYNPFHKGHLYQLEYMKKHGTDAIIVIMSGNFTQRGIPAIIDKYDRCRMALENGADVVFELPVYYAVGSAEYFAQGAVSILDKLHVADTLYFGSECGDIHMLTACAKILADESDTFKSSLADFLRSGLSFPSAQAKALMQEPAFISLKENSSEEAFKNTLSMPNNTLGIEYIKALIQRNSTICPVTLKREGSQYNETTISNDRFASANAIRTLLNAHADADLQDTLLQQVPDSVYHYLVDKSQMEFLFPDDFSTVLYYKLLSDIHTSRQLENYCDMTTPIRDTIIKNLPSFRNISDFCLACKSKNLTYTRISRCLTHILLELEQEQMIHYQKSDYAGYARLLGFSERGRDVLKKIKHNASIPIITKLPNALRNLQDPDILSSLRADIHAAQIYYMMQGQKYHHAPKNEYTQEIIRI